MLRSTLLSSLTLAGVVSVAMSATSAPGFLSTAFGSPEAMAGSAASSVELETPRLGSFHLTPGADDPDGKMLYELVCAMCHTMEPPPTLAPPISHAAAYYHHRFESEEEAVAAMVAFLREPSEEASLLPARAIERFGLMPPQSHLSDEQLAAVARYSLSLADTTHGRGMRDHPHDHDHSPGG